MSFELPEPIAAYIAAETHGDPLAVARCFTRDAVVHDENETHCGEAVIARWNAETRRKYGHRIDPLSSTEAKGEVVLTCRLAGDFPGSPVELDFAFRLAAGKISALEIRP